MNKEKVAIIIKRRNEGATGQDIAKELGISLPTYRLWMNTLYKSGLAKLPRPKSMGRPKATITKEMIAKEIINSLDQNYTTEITKPTD